MTLSQSGLDPRVNLSQEEMLDISRQISQTFSPDRNENVSKVRINNGIRINPPNRKHARSAPGPGLKLPTNELLEISQAVSRDFAPSRNIEKPELLLMPVDPHHVHAVWSVEPAQLNTQTNTPNPPPLTLRIYWLPDNSISFNNSNLFFDIPLPQNKHSQRIRIPISDTAYTAVIGERGTSHSLQPVVESNIVRVPADNVYSAVNTNNRHDDLPEHEHTDEKHRLKTDFYPKNARFVSLAKKDQNEYLFFTKMSMLLEQNQQDIIYSNETCSSFSQTRSEHFILNYFD
ncbi:DUF4912 domain-containing protein [Methylicorpusculum oleiharenae]|uniref:DUF4912 domain-containing protein n=1 Tax=Methylicorpusculum oleiharenae TaxID=1338687 RepID=UPI001E5A996B|nr:DUF4912 domain-containing protein [Methylicorpusculum oleiharenae]MCD2452533.1 DUF4912 domain-containing protein [Methylicorpusculum oleiharenae]